MKKIGSSSHYKTVKMPICQILLNWGWKKEQPECQHLFYTKVYIDLFLLLFLLAYALNLYKNIDIYGWSETVIVACRLSILAGQGNCGKSLNFKKKIVQCLEMQGIFIKAAKGPEIMLKVMDKVKCFNDYLPFSKIPRINRQIN